MKCGKFEGWWTCDWNGSWKHPIAKSRMISIVAPFIYKLLCVTSQNACAVCHWRMGLQGGDTGHAATSLYSPTRNGGNTIVRFRRVFKLFMKEYPQQETVKVSAFCPRHQISPKRSKFFFFFFFFFARSSWRRCWHAQKQSLWKLSLKWVLELEQFPCRCSTDYLA